MVFFVQHTNNAGENKMAYKPKPNPDLIDLVEQIKEINGKITETQDLSGLTLGSSAQTLMTMFMLHPSLREAPIRFHLIENKQFHLQKLMNR
jgi:hypothetical protein